MSKPRFIRFALYITVALLAGCVEKTEVAPPASRPAKLFTVKASDAVPPRRYPAVVEAHEKASLSFKVPGTLIEFEVKQGQEVKKGDLIARLDPRDFDVALNKVKAQLQETEAQERAMKIGVRPEDIRILESKSRGGEDAVRSRRKLF